MTGDIKITARKQSLDPLQEHLRERKAVWNKYVSGVITELIGLKRAFNGHGDDRLGLPASQIKYPLPGAITDFVGKVSDDFAKIMQEAQGIAQEQAEYANKRRKGKSEQPSPVTASHNAETIKNASWWGSRAWTYMSSLGSKDRWFRVGTLKASAVLEDHLEEIENSLLSNKIELIPDTLFATKIFLDSLKLEILDSYIGLLETRSIVKSKEQEIHDEEAEKIRAPDTGPSLGDLKAGLEKVVSSDEYLAIEKDMYLFNYFSKQNAAASGIKKLQNDYDNFFSPNAFLLISTAVNSDDATLHEVNEAIAKVKEILIRYPKFIEDANQILGSNVSRLEEMVKFAVVNINDDDIKKLASTALGRWLKQMKLKALPYTNERSARLKAAAYAYAARQKLNKYMDLVENKGTSLVKLARGINEIINPLVSLIRIEIYLVKMYNNIAEAGRLKAKVDRGTDYIHGIRMMDIRDLEMQQRSLIIFSADLTKKIIPTLEQKEKEEAEKTRDPQGVPPQ